MATYTHTSNSNPIGLFNPVSSWAGVLGTSYAASANTIAMTNKDRRS